MKTLKYLLITFIIIAFTLISCAEMPRCESGLNKADNNLIIIGFYHALIIPFSVLGKVFGIDVGLYRLDGNFSYWIGFIIGLMGYARLFVLLGEAKKD
ncbi:hypothetical protein [uncultured Draconibacterium sp.]|uniref:hypothetical protein n=1 Tax=uncultured Draconibacterium sp. TaxID=1573823 RepID=UPI002AA62C8C|nr:hypothetical protein [uncultured Draconibacterium sp.]